MVCEKARAEVERGQGEVVELPELLD